MNKAITNILVILLISPLLIQCASQSDIEDLRYQLRTVNRKLEDMKATTVGQLQKRQAAAMGQMDILEQQILELKSQLEESYHLNQRLREQNKELELAINSVAKEEAAKREEALQRLEAIQQEKEAKLADLNAQLKQQQESVKAIQEARIKDAERKAKEAAFAAELARAKAKAASSGLNEDSQQHIEAEKKKIKRSVVAPPIAPKSATPPKEVAAEITTPPEPASPAPAATDSSDDSDLKSAQRLYAQNQFAQALAIFTEIAERGSGPDAVEARFMMGECLAGEREYDKAIMQYQKIISQHPDHARAPAAMLQQAVAFEKLADKDTAKVIYKKLLKRHGSSPEAKIAQDKVDKL